MAILDQFGNPIEVAQLQEPQTARLAQLRAEFDTHPMRGLTPPRLAQIMQRAEEGDLTAQHEMFADMEEKDGHLFSVMDQRRSAIKKLDWDIVPPEAATAAEKADAEWVEEIIRAMEDFDDVLFDMTDGIGHGFSPQEMQWGRVERVQMPIKIEHRPQGWFKLANNPDISRNELRLRDNSVDGERLWPFGWLMHLHRARSGYVSRAGLYRVMAWPTLFKNLSTRDLAEFLEIHGLPLRLGTYNAGATREDKATLLRAVVNIGHDAAAIIPQGMMIDFKAAAQGDSKNFESMIFLMERIQSKVALGGTLTSGEGTHGTQALGTVHQKIAKHLEKSDAKQLAATLTRQLIYPIMVVNKGLSDPRRCPRLVFDTQEPEDLALLSESVPKLVGMGMQIPVHWAHEKLKIPMAADGQAVLSIPTPQDIVPPAERPTAPTPRKPVAPSQANLKATVTTSAAPAEPDALDDLAAGMAGEWQEVMSETITPIQQALAQAASLEEFRDGLEDVLSRIEPVKLAALLAHGQFAARAWGQLNQVKK